MKLKLLQKKTEAPDVESYIFEPSEPVVWKAGQFLHYVLHHEPTDDRGSDRWFTVASAPVEGHVMLTTRFNNERSSTFKHKLRNLKIGRSIEISLVDGDFVVDDFTQEYIFIAGGIGITPFRSILKQLHAENIQLSVTLLYANRDQHVIYKDELEVFAKANSNLRIHYIFSPEHVDEKKIRELVPHIQKSLFYVSGPEPMVESLGNTLKEMGIHETHIKQDWFPGYPVV